MGRAIGGDGRIVSQHRGQLASLVQHFLHFVRLNVAILAVTAALLLEPAGLKGYGYAELVALVSYWSLDRSMRAIFPVSYAATLPWAVALVPPLFVVSTPMPWTLALFLPLVAVLASGARRRQLGRLVAELRPRLT